jgi:Carboxypeptidase regulatory-like domain
VTAGKAMKWQLGGNRMRGIRVWMWVALVSLAPLVLSVDAVAQTASGSITGSVLDSAKSAVSGASVTVTNERTGESRTTTSNADGIFVVTPLQPSVYTIRVSKDGFSAAREMGVQVTVGLEVHRDFALQVASVATEITVTSGAEVPLDATSSRIGVNVTEREVSALPINGRQLSQLELQAPGATNAGTGNFQDIRFSGQSTEQNAIRYDGIEGSAIIDADPGNLSGETASPFHLQASLENVQEFRVDSNNYPAEYGTGDGGQISVITKSGSNAFHGAVYEYLRNNKFDARNFFDLGASKSTLRLNQFGASFGGPLVKDKLFFFAYYEGYRLRSGTNAIEAAPSSRFGALPDCGLNQSFPGVQCINPAIRQLLPGFHSPNAILIQPDTTTALSNSSLDVYQLQGLYRVQEDSGGLRFDYHLTNNNSLYFRYFRDQGANTYPEGITGRNVLINSVPQNGVAALTSAISSNLVNEAKFGFNEAVTNIAGVGPTVNGVDFSQIAINATGSITLSGIAGQGGSNAGLAIPGGLVRSNSASNGRSQPYTPYSLSFIDNLSYSQGIHNLKFGTEVRLIRMYTDRLGGTTYSFSNVTSLINGSLSTVDDLVDVDQPSPYNNGATGRLNLRQAYYIGYAQDEMKLRPNLTLNVGIRYEYYTPLHEINGRYVFFDTATGILSSPNFCYNPFASLQSICSPHDTTWYKSNPNNFLPRIGIAWSPFSSGSGLFGSGRTLLRAGFGIYTGPGQTEDQLQPAESDRVWTTPSGGTYCGQAPGCATSTANLTANFLTNPNNRAARFRAYDGQYQVPERLYQYSVSWQQDWGSSFVSTIAYVGSQGRNLFLRNVANRIVAVRTNTNPASGAAIPIRQFDIDCNNAPRLAGTPTAGCPVPDPVTNPNDINSVLHPYGEIDFKTSGGFDSYNALQTQLLRRFRAGLSLSAEYTYSKSYGDSGGSNEALTTADPYDYNFDRGYNIFDVRHNFNLSALYQLPFLRNQHGFVRTVLGNWEVGTILNLRSGLPVPVQITRPDTVFRGLPGTSVAGEIFGAPILSAGCPGNGVISAGVCTEAIINTPGGGNTRNVRRPDVVPGVPFFLSNGNLNPAAFATPQPGAFGNLMRNSVKGPNFRQADATVVKRFPIHESKSVEFRAEFFNILNRANFVNPPAQLGNVLPTTIAGLTASNTLQPGQPFTTATRGSFGVLNSTVAQTVGLGTNRQIQFALRLNF